METCDRRLHIFRENRERCDAFRTEAQQQFSAVWSELRVPRRERRICRAESRCGALNRRSVPRGRPLGSKNKPKPPTIEPLLVDDVDSSAAIPPTVADDDSVSLLSYTGSIVAAEEATSGVKPTSEWMRLAIYHARVAVLADIIDDTEAISGLELLLPSLRLVRDSYERHLAKLEDASTN